MRNSLSVDWRTGEVDVDRSAGLSVLSLATFHLRNMALTVGHRLGLVFSKASFVNQYIRFGSGSRLGLEEKMTAYLELTFKSWSSSLGLSSNSM